MPFLSEADRNAALRLARDTVREAVTHGRLPEQIPQNGIFEERRGAFVTLHVRGRLRGCIGVMEADRLLGETIVRCAASAALQDPRFPAMRPDELPGLQIEISVLSPLVEVRPEEIELGRHGLLIARDGRRGVLLPQVATEHRLTVEQFLEQTCLKAELPAQAWRQAGTQIFGFTCEILSDNVEEKSNKQGEQTAAP